MIRLSSAYLGLVTLLFLTGCVSVDEEIRDEKLDIQEKTRPSFVLGCNCPPVNPDTGKVEGESGPYLRVGGEFGDYPLGFKNILDATKALKGDEINIFEQAVRTYSSKISYSSSVTEVSTDWHCWTGICPAVEYFITDLKDGMKTWVYLSPSIKFYAHKCTYGEDPNAWTTEPCPVKGRAA